MGHREHSPAGIPVKATGYRIFHLEDSSVLGSGVKLTLVTLSEPRSLDPSYAELCLKSHRRE